MSTNLEYRFHFPDSGLNLLNGFDFYFDLFWMAWHWKPAIITNLYLLSAVLDAFIAISEDLNLKFPPGSMPPDPLVCSRLRVRISHPLPPPPLESPLRGPCIYNRSQRYAVKGRATSPSQTIIMLRSQGTVNSEKEFLSSRLATSCRK